MAIVPLEIRDLRGGVSDEHPSKIAENQVAAAYNVDYWNGWLGGRRNGSSAIVTISQPATFMHRHEPNSDSANDRLWMLLADGTFRFMTAAAALTTPSISPADTFNNANASFASLHGKLFIAAKTGQSRLHVYDGTSIRRTGVAAPVLAPSVADTGIGAYSNVRYFRVRFVQVSGSVVLRRSEPSPATTFTPSGAGLSARVSRPTLVGEGETHWEVEESVDQGNWYRIARVIVATTTYDDSLSSTALASDVNSFLSEDIGDYQNLPSARFLAVDDDRLVYTGNHEDASLDAVVGWTELSTQVGVGNDERAPLDAGSYIVLNAQHSGKMTGLKAFDRKIIVFKNNSISTLVRSASRTRAYVLGPTISRTIGAVPYSVCEGLDASGNACLYFVDSLQGPMRYGGNGLEALAPQLLMQWALFDQGASTIKFCEGIYHAEKGQYWIHVTQTGNQWPNFRWVFDRFTGGISVQTTNGRAYSGAMWLGKPHLSGDTTINKWDDPASMNDAGTAFQAYIRTKAYQPTALLRRFRVTMAALEMSVMPNPSTLNFKIIRNYGMETKNITVQTYANGDELTAGVASIIRFLDDAALSELHTVQFEIGDLVAVNGVAWQIYSLVVNLAGEGVSA